MSAGIQADKAGYPKIAEYYFKKIKSDEGLYRLGLNLFKEKDYKKSVEALNKIKQITQDVWLLMIKDYVYQGKFDEAKFLCDKEKLKEDLCTLSMAASGEIEIARLANTNDEFDNILQIKDEPSRMVVLYKYLNKQINPQSALMYLEKNKGKLEKSRDGNIVLAGDYFNRKEYQKAADALEKAKKLDPYYPQVYEHLIEVYKKLGNTKAVEQNRQVLRTLVWN